MFRFIYKVFRKINRAIYYYIHVIITFIRLKGNKVEVGKNFKSNGSPVLDVWDGGQLHFGDHVELNNGTRYNIIGRQQPCIFIVRNAARLTIGDHTGMSAATMVCSLRITIGSHVKIGGNTVIYDTDFHSLDAATRADEVMDEKNAKSAPVIIGDHVFIGAHSTILKGVTIGENSIIGSCSVVTRDVPPNQIWAGNPAKFIKSINQQG